MTSLETLALTKLVADKAKDAARSDLSPGVHDVDLFVHVHGSMAIGEDTTKAATASIPLLAALAYAIDAAGVVGPSVEKAILEGVARAMVADEETTALLLKRTGLTEKVDALKAKIAVTLPRVPVRGAVKAALHVDVVEHDMQMAAK